MTLSELPVGTAARVQQVKLNGQGQALVTRLEAMGLLPDRPVTVLRKATFGGPLHIRVGSTTELAIRRREADKVSICLTDREPR